METDVAPQCQSGWDGLGRIVWIWLRYRIGMRRYRVPYSVNKVLPVLSKLHYIVFSFFPKSQISKRVTYRRSKITVRPIGKFISEGATEYQLDRFENKENSNIKTNWKKYFLWHCGWASFHKVYKHIIIISCIRGKLPTLTFRRGNIY